jgi:integrase/recombinase XerD
MEVVVTVAEFKHQLKVKGYAPATIDSYRKNLDQFAAWLSGHDIGDLRQVTRQIIIDYQSFVMAQPLAAETRALKLRAVKRLFEYLEDSHQLLVNPTEGIVETCRQNKKIGPVLSVAEMQKLLEQPNLSWPGQIRDRAIMEVFYATGIRLNELLSLEVYHVDIKSRVLYIRRGKGNRQRVVPLGKQAARYLAEYLNKIRPIYARKNPKTRTLFLCQSGQPLTREALRSRLQEYRAKAGITKPVSPHVFRRSCATHLLQGGADIRYVQKLLGHKEIKTTQQYTRIKPTEVKKIHETTHPNQKGEKP